MLQYGIPFLSRGYAIMAVDRPGQGATVKTAPQMPLYADTVKIVSAILDYTSASLTSYILADKIALYGELRLLLGVRTIFVNGS